MTHSTTDRRKAIQLKAAAPTFEVRDPNGYILVFSELTD
jgi:hypothetical protein